MPENNGTKPLWKSTKLLYSLIVVVLVVGSLLALALTGTITVSADQVFDFGEWLITMLIGGHSLQEIARHGAEAIKSRKNKEEIDVSE